MLPLAFVQFDLRAKQQNRKYR